MSRHIISLLAVALLCSCSGCLYVNHSTRVIRDKEPVLPVQFESPQAQRIYSAGVHDLQSHKQPYNFQVSAMPLLWWRSTANELSDNAIYNDQISVCDTNGDNFITMEEAMAYRSIVVSQIRLAEKNKIAESKADASAPPAEPPNQLRTPPPGVIRSATRTSE
jgi:hypothetical protein